MLDLDDPQTPHIFAASRQEDLILDYCKRITLSDAAGRRFMLEVIRPAFAALHWLNRERFGACPVIASAIDELERQVEALVRMRLADFKRLAIVARQCPVCGSKPARPSRYDPVPYCSSCLDIVIPTLELCRQGFGTDAI